MKHVTGITVRLVALLALALVSGSTGFAQPDATWGGGAGDGDWNNAANWDIGVPAEGTNALIATGNTVNYNAAMAAPSFGLLQCGGVLNINAAGFVSAAIGDGALGIGVAGTRAFVNLNSGGAVAVSGGVTLSNNAALTVASGGSLTVGGNLLLGRNGTGNTGIVTNSGGTISALTTQVNPNNNSSSSLLMLNGGMSDLGAVTVKRSGAGSGGFSTFGTEGLIISNGVVRMTSLDVGGTDGNSFLTMYLANGGVTNGGTMTVRQVTGGRSSRFLQSGGVFVSGSVNLRGNTASANNSISIYSVNGGTNLVEGFLLGGASDVTGTIRLTNAARIYLGAGGMTSQGTLNTRIIALNNGGSFGAQADWSGTEPILLAGGALDAADLDGNPHAISLSGVVSGTAPLIKVGGGTLTLNVANTFSGSTLINQGTLALGSSGTLASSAAILTASGTVLDVSAVAGGFPHAATRTLGGFGSVVGDVAPAAGAIINPGSNTITGTLTCSNNLTEAGGVVNHFDLSTNPSGPNNDLLIVTGDLNVSAVNTLEIVGGGTPGSAHPLIKYGGSFNGTLANFSISGATGSLSNDASGKVIYLVIASAIRNPTSVVWVGNATVNDWDTVNRTNWSNEGVLDYFVSGDQVRFDAAGAAHPVVNLVGNNAPATTTVDAVGNYTFAGGGGISGTGSLTKTNSGTLTITATNSYTGPTILGGGVLEATTLAIAGSPSSLGAAAADPNNLVFHGGTLRYLGETVATDRPATLNAGAVVDVASNETSLTLNGALTGAGGLTKAGPGTLVLGVANTHAGGTVISSGRLQVNANAATGTGGLTNNAATLRVQGALVLDNVVDWSGNCSLEFNGVGGNNTALRGAWSGNGTVNVYFVSANASQTFTIGGAGAGGGHMWDFAGTVDFGTNSGFLRINNDNSTFNFGSSNATFNLGTGTGVLNQRNGSTTTYLGALIGGPGTRVAGRGNTGASGTTTYEIGGNNLSTTFEGEINNGSGTTAITKVGTGTLALTGTSIYSGSTLVQNGTLQVDGALTASPAVSVLGGTLAGRGTISGAVDVQVGGTLSVGDGIPGQMTINSTLTFASGSTNFVEINKSDSVIDNVAGLTGVSYGGTLVISMVQGTLANGDSFKLFDAPPGSYAGAFEAIIPETPGSGLRWDLSSLTVDGTLKVTLPGVRIASFGFDAGNLSASGSGGTPFAEYQVLTSTNVAAPLTEWETNATAQFDGSGGFSFTTPLDPATPRRFFRLQFQSP